MKKALLTIILISIISFICLKESISQESGMSVYKIWDQAKHNGFPDLIRFKNAFYCSFREGNNHCDNTNTGRVRIVRSEDGKNWESVALFELKGTEMREAHLSETPEGRIMVAVGAGYFFNNHFNTLATYVSFSDKSGFNFSSLEKTVVDPQITTSREWIWRVTWNKGIGYGIMYQIHVGKNPDPWEAFLVKTTDGKYYEKLAKIELDGDPNESTIRFDRNDNMYILIRRDKEDRMGFIAESPYPYRELTYNRLKVQLGGPNFQFLNKRQLVIGTRSYEKSGSSTAILMTDLKGNVLKTTKLPSGGDTSYPGMVIHRKKLWVAYYSSHEGKSNIYMGVIFFKDMGVKQKQK